LDSQQIDGNSFFEQTIEPVHIREGPQISRRTNSVECLELSLQVTNTEQRLQLCHINNEISAQIDGTDQDFTYVPEFRFSFGISARRW
jgi:hypothetical protein